MSYSPYDSDSSLLALIFLDIIASLTFHLNQSSPPTPPLSPRRFLSDLLFEGTVLSPHPSITHDYSPPHIHQYRANRPLTPTTNMLLDWLTSEFGSRFRLSWLASLREVRYLCRRSFADEDLYVVRPEEADWAGICDAVAAGWELLAAREKLCVSQAQRDKWRSVGGHVREFGEMLRVMAPYVVREEGERYVKTLRGYVGAMW
ncbi:hypothetical protein BJ508DRAFT_29007 [Ascobolus immersus RN42]|uniref:Uncharacterized protein n=1 Tax=Ascobolus immersus RN42 TaxID=1160509 RepID=A0A3N4HM83_ASCIM|nr:hypothetical protein BJ508DRAFT_29007 [Ascobolus immersus RN42]